MNDYKIVFSSMDWESTMPGVQQKEVILGDRKLRLVSFNEAINANDWCYNGHIGYVLKGTMKINFNGNIVKFSTGDTLIIPEGEEHRHKTIINAGETVELLLFEDYSG